MAGETIITIVGNLVDEPELKFSQSGAARASFRIAATPRVYDKQSNEWRDGESLFLPVTVWRQAAENVAESLQKGTRVIVTGALKQRSFEDKQGQKRTVFELDAEEIGVSLRSATATVTRRPGAQGGQGQGGGNWDAGAGRSQQQPGAWPQQTARAPQNAGGRGSWGGHDAGADAPPPF
ncbi:single-stranded DNA-binding protein [Streptomyces sp. NPDC090085]|uniref:single-stranded DNA-binding protein n=1 Tax=Streptomyces sp. NPDC090085 TaxID=3365943 RepID=UPI003820CAE8